MTGVKYRWESLGCGVIDDLPYAYLSQTQRDYLFWRFRGTLSDTDVKRRRAIQRKNR